MLFFSLVWIFQRTVALIVKGKGTIEIVGTILQNAIAYPLNSIWYIQASLVAALMLLPFLKKKKLNLSIAVGLVLYCWGLLCHNYHFLVEGTVIGQAVEHYLVTFITARNGVFYGFIFLALGVKCAEIVERQILCSRLLGILSLLMYVVVLIEIMFIRTYTPEDDILLSTTVFVPILFLFTATINTSTVSAKGRKFSLMLRNLSTGLYLLHRPILWFFSIIDCSGIVKFCTVMITGTAICMISYRAKNTSISTLLR